MATFPPWAYRSYNPEWVKSVADSGELIAAHNALVAAYAELDSTVTPGDDVITLQRSKVFALIEACELLFKLRDKFRNEKVQARPALKVVEPVE